MKNFWFKVSEWDKKAVVTAIESGFEAIYVPEGKVDKVKELAVVNVISKDKKADMVLGKDVEEVVIDEKSKEDDVVKHKGKIPVIIMNKDWTIIPLENLISKTTNLIQHVKTAKEAKLALETMEVGADGIILETNDLAEIKEVAKLISENENEKLNLVEATITEIENLGVGNRVCVDTASILRPGQGLLVGDSSRAMFLVHNENIETPYCAPRPFRVNAGAAHAYVMMPEEKTNYLMELGSGSIALVVDPKGNTERIIVGRAKIEKRPLMIIKAEAEGKKFSIVLQNAETIRLTKPDGQYASVTRLKKGDKVLAYLQEEGIGMHFGQKLKETITEK